MKNYYDKNSDNFKFLRCLSRAFNNLEQSDKVDIKSEETAEFYL